MNEQILELLKQASKLANTDDNKDIDRNFDMIVAEKFAELIVRECLNVMSKTSEEANKRFTYMGDDVPTVVHQMNIEKHFGVEE